MINVFVYGTLRKVEGNHQLLETATCLAEQCWTKGVLYDTGFGYPAMKPSRSSKVYGELYAIDESHLRKLDQLEGYALSSKNNLYERIQQTVYTDKGEFTAYLYIAAREELGNRIIPTSDWKEYNLFSKKMATVLYFAYGSCMDDQRFNEKGVEHYFQNMLGVGVLTGYTLRFTRKSIIDQMGRADIVEEGGVVEGKVYEIPVKALKEYLYEREGAPTVYRPTFVTIERNKEKIQALTFVVNNKKAETAPPKMYEEEILRGASGFLSKEYISSIKNHIDYLRKQTTGGR